MTTILNTTVPYVKTYIKHHITSVTTKLHSPLYAGLLLNGTVLYSNQPPQGHRAVTLLGSSSTPAPKARVPRSAPPTLGLSDFVEASPPAAEDSQP
jgi:hypothetical protein